MSVGFVLARLPDDLSDRGAFAERLVAIYGAQGAVRLVTSMAVLGPHAYWSNPLRPGAFAPVGEAVPGLPGVRAVPRDADLPREVAAERGEIYLQNPSSVLAADLLGVQANDEVLDLAAAPGGKTIRLAAAMGNGGRIAAVEPVRGRFHRLKANLERCGVTNTELYMKDGRGIGRTVPERFDRVLLDAPCSSEARMRWDDPSTYGHWRLKKVKEAQRKQKSLLRSGYAALKPGGRLVYCTCSLSVEENELVVAHLLKRTDARIAPLDVGTGAELPVNRLAGLTAWSGKALAETLAGTLRIVPQPPWDGFYIAAIEKPAS